MIHTNNRCLQDTLPPAGSSPDVSPYVSSFSRHKNSEDKLVSQEDFFSSQSSSCYDLHDGGSLKPVDLYGFASTILPEPTTYHDDIFHPQWKYSIDEEFATI
jgi:hypothetical protein